jgi:hypothetical protein
LGLSRVVDAGSENEDSWMPFYSSYVVVIMALVGVIFRLRSYGQDLWLDEVWSILDVNKSTDFFSAVTRLSDNNHPLHSAYLYLIGGRASSLVVRLPALLFGFGALVAVSFYRDIWPKKAATLLFCFASCSYLFVLYCTEARGYAGLLFGMMSAQFFLERLLRSEPKRRHLFGFCCAMGIGLLSHGSFLFYAAAVCLWLLTVQLSNRSLLHYKALSFASIIFLCLAATAYFYFYRRLPQGTGILVSKLETVLNALTLTFGLPPLSAANPAWGTVSLLGALVVLASIPYLLWLVRRAKDPRWILCGLLVICYPALVLVVLEPRVLFVRYFLVSVVGYYWLLALGLAYSRRSHSVMVVGLFLFANGYLLARLWVYDRGQSFSALEHIETSQDNDKTLGSDQDFRAKMLLQYRDLVHSNNSIRYVSKDESPHWYLKHSVDVFAVPEAEIEVNSIRYTLDRSYVHTAESGWTWFLYRR